MESKKELNYNSLIKAVRTADLEAVEQHLINSVDPSANNHYAFQLACANGFTPIVRVLLNHPSSDPKANNQYGFWVAAQNNHHDIVDLLLNDKRIDPTASENLALVQACTHGHENIVRRLIKDKRINPSIPKNLPIMKAIENGHVETVTLLLSIHSVTQGHHFLSSVFSNLMECRNTVMAQVLLTCEQLIDYRSRQWFLSENLRLACRFGLKEIVQILLPYTKILKIGDSDYDLIIRDHADAISIFSEAAYNGHLEVIEILLADERIDPFELHYDALCQAAKGGHLEVVKRLANVAGIDPITLNYALNYAAMHGRIEIIKFLLNDKSVDPAFNNHHAIKIASAHNQNKVVEILMPHKRLNPKFSEWGGTVISNALFHKNTELAKTLIRNQQIAMIWPQINSNNLEFLSEVFQEIEEEKIVLFYLGLFYDDKSNLFQLPKDIREVIANNLNPSFEPKKKQDLYNGNFAYDKSFLPDGHMLSFSPVNNFPIKLSHPVSGLLKSFDNTSGATIITSLSNRTFLIAKSNYVPRTAQTFTEISLCHPVQGLLWSHSTKVIPHVGLELPNGNIVLGGYKEGDIIYNIIDPTTGKSLKDFKLWGRPPLQMSVLANGYLGVTYLSDRGNRPGDYGYTTFFRNYDIESGKYRDHQENGDKLPEDFPREGLSYR